MKQLSLSQCSSLIGFRVDELPTYEVFVCSDQSYCSSIVRRNYADARALRWNPEVDGSNREDKTVDRKERRSLCH